MSTSATQEISDNPTPRDNQNEKNRSVFKNPLSFYVQDDCFTPMLESRIKALSKVLYESQDNSKKTENKVYMNQLNENFKVRLTRKPGKGKKKSRSKPKTNAGEKKDTSEKLTDEDSINEAKRR